MKDISIFEGVVVFEAEGYTYQAIWKETEWDMAALDQARVEEMHTVRAPRDASPGTLLKAWWSAQKNAGTYKAPPEYS